MAKSPARIAGTVAMATAGARVHPSDDMGGYSVGFGGVGPSRITSTTQDHMESLSPRHLSPRMALEQFGRSSKYDRSGQPPTPESKADQIVDAKKFVQNHFHRKECKLFVPKTALKKSDGKKPTTLKDFKCHCGELLESHSEYSKDTKSIVHPAYHGFLDRSNGPVPDKLPDVEWSKDHIKASPTNAFGTITFNVEQIGGTKPAKYVRLADTDKVEDALELMTKHWRIMEPQPPKLVISVNGGAKSIRLDGRKRETFSNGLIKAARTTSAWLITSGFNIGVMKEVGMAVNEGQSFQYDGHRVTHVLRCIGIAPWGYIRGRNDLNNKVGESEVCYRTSNDIKRGEAVPLNPDHTHFLFVDDGFRNVYRGVDNFRSKFEAHITEKGIPVVLVLVEGGTKAIEATEQSLDKQIPVVVCAGTGRAADILAFAYAHRDKTEGKKMLAKELRKEFGKEWGNEADSKCEKFVDIVYRCVEREKLMQIFHIEKHEELDLAILSVLLKAGAENAERRKQLLNLAMTWNRAGIAQAEIFLEDITWKEGVLGDMLTTALIENKVEFVRLILKQGVVMKEYLTLSQLEKLYNETSKPYLMELLKIREKKEISMTEVSKFLEEVLDKYDDAKTAQKHQGQKGGSCGFGSGQTTTKTQTTDEERADSEERGFHRPYQQLFIWAILVNRPDMAQFFWEMSEEPIASAIAASRICGKLSNMISRFEEATRKSFAKSKEMFEDLAVKVLDECHHMDPEKAMMLVERKSPMWSEMTCLQMAASVNDQAFLASVACQNSINTVWKRGILWPWHKFALGVMFPPCIPFFASTSTSGVKLSDWLKILTFYAAPITKYSLFLVWYFFFLLLYVYMILVDFKEKPTITEYCCIVWIFTFLVNSIHTFLAFPSPTIRGKIRDWFGVLEALEGINVVIVFIAFGLRWRSEYLLVAKTIYCINAVVFILGIMKLYTANSSLGPKLYMIIKMLRELFLFVAVLVVFLLTYGVASQGLLYPSRQRDWHVLKDVLYYPFWQLYGEIYLEEIETDFSCQAREAAMNVTGVLDSQCRTSHWLVYILLSAYLLVGNVLLLNLLIAIFSRVFELVEKNSVEIWKYQMYFLVMEFDVKVAMFPPFSIIAHIILIIRWFFRKMCGKKKAEEKQFLQPELCEYLQLFEKEMMANYLRNSKATVMDSIQGKMSQLQTRMDEMASMKEVESLIDQARGDYKCASCLSAAREKTASRPPVGHTVKRKKKKHKNRRQETDQENLTEAEQGQEQAEDAGDGASNEQKTHWEKAEQKAKPESGKLTVSVVQGKVRPEAEQEINIPDTQLQASLSNVVFSFHGRQTPESHFRPYSASDFDDSEI